MFLAVWGGRVGTFGGHSHLSFCEPNKRVLGNFPGGPVVKNPSCKAGHTDLIPGQGTKIPHAWDQLSPVTQMKDPATKILSVATETQGSQINKLKKIASECFSPCNFLPPPYGLLCLYVRQNADFGRSLPTGISLLILDCAGASLLLRRLSLVVGSGGSSLVTVRGLLLLQSMGHGLQ